MSVIEEIICRLCLKDAINKFVEIDEVMKQMFDILFLKLDLKISKDPIICQDCLGVATKCLNFKSFCINTEKIILSYSTDVEQVKHNIKTIYKKWKHVETVDEDLNICRICLARLEKNNSVCLDDFMNENMFEMLSGYIPELDFNIIKDPIICVNCRATIHDYLKFTLQCLDIEKYIKAYYREEGTDIMGQVKLGNILDAQKHAFTKELNTFEDTEHVYLEAYSGFIKPKELNIEEEDINLKENSYETKSELRLDKCDGMFHFKGYGIETESNKISLKTKDYGIKECAYQKKVQTNTVEDILEVKKNNSDDQGILKKYMSISEGALEPKQKNNINRHVLMTKYKCSLCAYEAKHKGNLKSHMLVHKDPLEVKMHKCSICTYTCRYNSGLVSHMLVHKDPSEIKMYKCSICAYACKYNNGLVRHMLVHKDPSEIKMYKCSLCAFEAKHKVSLQKHILLHKDPSEIKTYKCPVCAYESKHKSYFKNHMLVHKNLSEIKMYKCSLCPYESRRKSHIESHMLVHKDPLEIKMYKCSLCAYESKHKCNLEKHILVHKDPLEIKMFKCSRCAYEAKQKGSLKTHMLVHKDPSEKKMYKCSLCPYETNQKSNLKKHMLVHKDVSEIKMYKG